MKKVYIAEESKEGMIEVGELNIYTHIIYRKRDSGISVLSQTPEELYIWVSRVTGHTSIAYSTIRQAAVVGSLSSDTLYATLNTTDAKEWLAEQERSELPPIEKLMAQQSFGSISPGTLFAYGSQRYRKIETVLPVDNKYGTELNSVLCKNGHPVFFGPHVEVRQVVA